jgi:hypothetical protein
MNIYDSVLFREEGGGLRRLQLNTENLVKPKNKNKNRLSRAEAIHPCSRQFIRGYCRVTATMDRLEFAMRERKRRENLNDNN